MTDMPSLQAIAPLAYLDGGTGSMAIQMVIAGALSVGFLVKTQWKALVARLQSRSKSSVQE